MANAKFVKTAAAVALGASVVTTAVAPGAASAATTYKIKDGKLYKNGKIAKGYVVYKGKLYKNGKLNKGYAKVGTGSKMKLYYNSSLKKGFKTANNATLLFKDGVLFKGYKQAGSNERLYKDGKLTTGWEVYTDAEGVKFLYSKGYLYKNLKTAKRGGVTNLFENGKLAEGTKAFQDTLFTDGTVDEKDQVFEDVLYVGGKKAEGTVTFEDVVYIDGVKDAEKPEITAEDKTVAYGSEAVDVATLATVKDNSGEEIKAEAKISFDGKAVEKIDTKTPGVYTVTFTAKDKNGNEATKEVKVTVAEAVKAEVESVEAINGTTLVVTFNKAVDKEDAEKATIKVGNYSLTDGTLSEDGRTLTLTSTTAIVAEAATVEVPAIVTKADKTVKTAKYVTILNYKDTVAPELVSATASAKESTKDIVVTFNETLKNTNVIAYVNGVAAQAVVEGKTVKVTSTTALKAGETATIKLVNVQDVTGNYTTSNPLETTVTVVADTVAPAVVSTKVVGEDTVQVTFDKEVATDDTKLPYLSANGVKVSKFNAGVVDAKDKKVVNYQLEDLSAFKDDKLSGTFYLPAGAVTDKAGNISAESNTAVSFAIDKVKPVISSIEFTKDNDIVVKFSKEISKADEAKIAFQNPVTGAKVTFENLKAEVSADDATKAIISGDFVDGTYELTLASGFATDKASSKNVSDTNKSTLVVKKSAVVPANDKTAPVVTLDSDIDFNNNALTFDVEDSESALDFSSIRNVNNYTINGKALPVGTVITTNAKDEKAKSAEVTITVPAGTVAKTITGKFAVSGIKDIAGNTISGLVTSENDVTLKDDVAPTISSAKVYSDNTIVISFSEAVKVGGKDVLISLDGAPASAPTFTVGIGENAGKLVATVEGAYKASKVEVSYDKTANKTTDNEGNELKEFKTFAATK